MTQPTTSRAFALALLALAALPAQAQVVVFTGQAGKVVWDDLTLGANDPQPPPAIPEPATAWLWLAGLSAVAAARQRALRRIRS